jgi:hypothetical protein
MSDAPDFPSVDGLLDEPIARRGGALHAGRFQIDNLLLVDNPDDVHLTASLSVRDLADAADGNLLYTDQIVQRGIKPGKAGEVELSLADGYPDPDVYIFYEDKADEIASALLSGQKLHLSPLVWNLRPGHFQGYLDTSARNLVLYSGRIYLPDGHHRHQGIVQAFRIWQTAQDEYPDFDVDRLFTVDVYFMSRQEEAQYFFEKNVLGKDVDKSKSFDLTTRDPLSNLAKALIDKSPSLKGNVNRVTDRLSAASPQVITLSTLHTMMQRVVGEDSAPGDERIEELATWLAAFYEMLAEVRPELGLLSLEDRQKARRESMAGQAVLMHGFAELMREFVNDVEADGLEDAARNWKSRLAPLGKAKTYKSEDGEFSDDLFLRTNPLWRELGVIQSTRSGRDAVSNVRQTRDSVADLLRERVGLS